MNKVLLKVVCGLAVVTGVAACSGNDDTTNGGGGGGDLYNAPTASPSGMMDNGTSGTGTGSYPGTGTGTTTTP